MLQPSTCMPPLATWHCRQHQLVASLRGAASLEDSGTRCGLKSMRYPVCQSPPPASSRMSSPLRGIILSSSNWTQVPSSCITRQPTAVTGLCAPRCHRERGKQEFHRVAQPYNTRTNAMVLLLGAGLAVVPTLGAATAPVAVAPSMCTFCADDIYTCISNDDSSSTLYASEPCNCVHTEVRAAGCISCKG
jgi:hypothetical protein